MRAKSILLSKTFWVNVAAILLMILEDQEAIAIIPDVVEAHMVKILAVINVILRAWTKTEVQFRGVSPTDAKLSE
jgi:hypothetical protein